jgi:carboxyl-terminal processing protease
MTFAALALAFSPQAPAFDANTAWESVSKAISTRYYAREARGEEMAKRLKETEPLARAAKSPTEFDQVIDSMIASFKDSHFAFLTRNEQGFYVFDSLVRGDKALKMPNIGAWFARSGESYTVTMVLDGGAAAEAGLRKGDLVTRIAGQLFEPVAPLAGLVGQEATLEWTRAGVPMSAQVKVTEQAGLDMFHEATRKSGRVVERQGKKIGVMRPWTMVQERFKNTLHGFVYGQASATDAFVLDLRDGFGGRPEGYADPFFRPEAVLEWDMGTGGSMKQQFGYQRPLVVLTNGGTRSAREVLALILKRSGRATLVGTRTAGDVLGTSPIPIQDWAYLEIPMVDLKVDGERLERVGVAPMIEVQDGYGPNGEDLVLEAGFNQAVKLAGR